MSVDRQAAMEMVQRSGQQGVPVTLIDNEVIVGFDRPRLERALARPAAATPVRLGASVADAEKITREKGGGPTVGAYVGSVKPGSVASRAGLRPGGTITLSYLRAGQHQQVQVTVNNEGGYIIDEQGKRSD